MKRQVVDCDRCSEKNLLNPQTVGIVTGRSFDGVETNDEYEKLDLCPTCLRQELGKFLEKLDHKEATKWRDTVKEMKRANYKKS